MCHKKLSRKEALKLLGGSGLMLSTRMSPLAHLLDSLISGIVVEAKANELGTDPKNFVYLSIDGGPAQYYCTLSLTPNGSSDALLDTPEIGNVFVEDQGGTPTAIYKSIRVGDYHVPAIWNEKLITPTSAKPSMSELLSNVLELRGVRGFNDGHPNNRRAQVSPINGGVSIAGLVADQSEAPIPAIYYSDKMGFKSSTGIEPVRSGAGLDSILQPFQAAGERLRYRESESIEALMDQASFILSQKSHLAPKAAEKIFSDRMRSKAVFKKNLESFATDYQMLLQKYKTLIHASLQESFEFLGTKDLVSVDKLNPSNSLASTGDFFIGNPSPGTRLEDTIASNTYIAHLAESMAVAEYTLKNELSSSLTINSSSIMNLKSSGGSLFNFGMDSHSVGQFNQLFYFSAYWRAVMSCLYEFRRVLLETPSSKGDPIWNKTLVQVGGDFNRVPRPDGTGSDHGWTGSSAFMLSGLFKKHEIIGDIRVTQDRGTWGLGANLSELNNRPVSYRNVASTLANILGTQKPEETESSLLEFDESGNLRSTKGRPVNVIG